MLNNRSGPKAFLRERLPSGRIVRMPWSGIVAQAVPGSFDSPRQDHSGLAQDDRWEC
jgi:hypothetical protein